MTNPNQQVQTPEATFDADMFDWGIYTRPQREIAVINIGVIGLATVPVATNLEMPLVDAYTVRFDQ